MDILDILLDILLKPPQPFIGLFFHFRKVLLEGILQSYRILQFYTLQGYPYRKEILHSEGKEIFKYFQSSY